jgi:hypothetical protein
MTDRNDFPELTEAQKALWRAVVSDAREMSAGLHDGTATREDMQGALYHLLSCDIDWDMLINALHVPPDAGPYAPALERILRRIPDGWGRWRRPVKPSTWRCAKVRAMPATRWPKRSKTCVSTR